MLKKIFLNLIKNDLFDSENLIEAMGGCDFVFHLGENFL